MNEANAEESQDQKGKGEKKKEEKEAKPATAATAMPAEAWTAQAATAMAYSLDIFDTGATVHVTSERNRLYNVQHTEPFPIRTANGDYVYSTLTGDMDIKLPIGQHTNTIQISNIRYDPSFTSTLISPNQLEEHSKYSMLIKNGKMSVRDRNDRLLGMLTKRNGVYAANWDLNESTAYSASAAAWPKISLHELHLRLGHANYQYLKHMANHGSLVGFRLDPNQQEEKECVTCALTKIKRTPISTQRATPRATKFGEHFHMDIWGPAKVQTLTHGRYTLTLVDDATRWGQLIVMREKSDGFAKYVAFQSWLKTQYGITIKTLQSDNDAVFLSREFEDFLQSNGTQR